MLSEEARAQIAANKGRGRRWLEGEDVELVDSLVAPHRIVTLREAEPGVELWAYGAGRCDRHGEPLGGYVVAVDRGWSGVDPDTGEIGERPDRYRLYDPLVAPLAKAFTTLTADEIDPDSIVVVHDSDLGHAVRRMCAHVCGHDRRNPPGRLTHHETDLILYAAALARAAMLGR
jgi:hypothetical protein